VFTKQYESVVPRSVLFLRVKAKFFTLCDEIANEDLFCEKQYFKMFSLILVILKINVSGKIQFISNLRHYQTGIIEKLVEETQYFL
jgi:hypothetical protein